MKLFHLSSKRIFNTGHMIFQPKLEEIMAFLVPRISGETPAVVPLLLEEDHQNQVKAEAKKGPASVSNGGGTANIAVVNVDGTLMNRGSFMDAWSGACTYENLRAEVKAAREDRAVDAIMLRIDSCGGEASGAFDLAQFIYEGRNQKPIWASVDDSAYSAAYLIAAACDKICVTSTGGVGSIGIIAMHRDQSGLDEKAGLKYTVIHAGARKADGNPHAPLSDEAKTEFQSEIDRLYGMFTGDVAKYRGLTSEFVAATEARTYQGDRGISAGLADHLANFDRAMELLAGHVVGLRGGTGVGVAASAAAPLDAQMGANDVLADATRSEASDELAVSGDKEEISMPETKNESGAEAQSAGNVATLAQVLNLCSAAGKSAEYAMKLFGEGLSIEAVSAKLMSELRSQEAPSMKSSVAPKSSLMAQIMSAAAEKAASTPGLTKEQAFVALLNQNPAAYDQYLAANPAQTSPFAAAE